MVLYCADSICNLEGLGIDLEAVDQETYDRHLAAVGVNPGQVEELRQKLHEEVDAMVSILGAAV